MQLISSRELSIFVQTHWGALPLGGVTLMLWAWMFKHTYGSFSYLDRIKAAFITILTSGLLQIRVPTFGSYFFEVVP